MATRESYNTVAESYARLVPALETSVLDRALLRVFADVVQGSVAEFARVLAPGGYLQLAFHVGDTHRHRTEGYGHEGISLDIHHLPVERVCALLAQAEFSLQHRTILEPGRYLAGGPAQARLLARLPG